MTQKMSISVKFSSLHMTQERLSELFYISNVFQIQIKNQEHMLLGSCQNAAHHIASYLETLQLKSSLIYTPSIPQKKA